MEQKTTLEITPTQDDIILVQGLADGMGATKIAVDTGTAVNKVYERISLAKAKYNAPTNENLVALFMRNKLIK